MECFDIPVVLFIFKRFDTTKRIIERLAEIRPQKLYLISDQGRNDEEITLVNSVRERVVSLIDWKCELITDFADENRGVYGNIGLGAIRVLSKEKWAIFLEDDNLPELTFFQYCKEMLVKYENDSRILWVCGTNYLGEYKPNNNCSYMFTSHILPCGWASWSSKFLKNYDKDLVLFDDLYIQEQIKNSFFDKRLYNQTLTKVRFEYLKKKRGLRYHSWDYHMMWSIRANGMLGISPASNQILNIGIDEFSEHGFKNKRDWATKRLCGMKSYPLELELKHPKTVLIDCDYEKRIEKILLYPWYNKFYMWVRSIIIKFFKLEEDFRIKEALKRKRHKN